MPTGLRLSFLWTTRCIATSSAASALHKAGTERDGPPRSGAMESTVMIPRKTLLTAAAVGVETVGLPKSNPRLRPRVYVLACTATEAELGRAAAGGSF